MLELPLPVEILADRLLDWYQRNRRDFPWRDTRELYPVWLSEVMLQQTTTAAALPYYTRFLKTYPTLEELARADEQEVLSLWAGLGYYSRARNFQKAAQIVCEQHEGCFPTDLEAALALPGVGRYTAGAVLSIAYNLPYPVLDGNVRRFLIRLLALDQEIKGKLENRLWTLLTRVSHHPSVAPSIRDFNQSLMEMGALVCTPRNPRCSDCPVVDSCLARKRGLEEKLPIGPGRQAGRTIERTAIIIGEGDRYLLRQNTAAPNRGLWEFPAVEGRPGTDLEARVLREYECRIEIQTVFRPVTHQITFRRFRLTPVLSCLKSAVPRGLSWVQPGRSGFPLTASVNKILRRLSLL